MQTQPEDFSKLEDKQWRTRRIFCGFVLALYYATIAFIISLIPTDADSADSNLQWVNDHQFAMVGLFGFLGCVLYISLWFVKGNKTADMPIRWYVVRPFQGVLLSFFIYLAVRAGQLAFFSGGGPVDEANINLYSIALAAALTGIFSEQAYAKLEDLAKKAFKVEEEEGKST